MVERVGPTEELRCYSCTKSRKNHSKIAVLTIELVVKASKVVQFYKTRSDFDMVELKALKEV